MLKEVKNASVYGKLDIVLTKSISRLGRNTVDILRTLQQLTALGVEVIFDEQNLSSNDASSSFLISLLESVAEEENRNNSQNTYWGIKKRVMDGSSKLFMRKCYGYTHDSCGNLITEPQEAEIVQYIFQLYLQGASIVGIRKN
ncbi:MAG: recombinase family protein [Ruminococcus sp.]|nr:recombinase family protein [Ruminococcus sp.]